jgi:hypothetical protein
MLPLPPTGARGVVSAAATADAEVGAPDGAVASPASLADDGGVADALLAAFAGPR